MTWTAIDRYPLGGSWEEMSVYRAIGLEIIVSSRRNCTQYLASAAKTLGPRSRIKLKATNMSDARKEALESYLVLAEQAVAAAKKGLKDHERQRGVESPVQVPEVQWE